MIDFSDRAEARVSELLILGSDRAESSKTELNTRAGECPEATSQGVFRENVCEIVERGHDLYQVIDRDQQRAADSSPKSWIASDASARFEVFHETSR